MADLQKQLDEFKETMATGEGKNIAEDDTELIVIENKSMKMRIKHLEKELSRVQGANEQLRLNMDQQIT